MWGSLSPSVLAKNKRNAVFSLSIRKDRLFIRKVVLEQTNFRRKLLCDRVGGGD